MAHNSPNRNTTSEYTKVTTRLLYVEYVFCFLWILYVFFSYFLLYLFFLASSYVCVVVYEGAHKIGEILVYLRQLV